MAPQWRRVLAIIIVAFAPVLLGAAERRANPSAPEESVLVYLRAAYARDFAKAYELISSRDRRVRDLDQYLRQRGPFNGFTLEVARRLSETIELTPVESRDTAEGVLLRVRYRVPDPDAIAPLVYRWDSRRLNSLSDAERRSLLQLLDGKIRARSLAMKTGEQSFDLVREKNQWRLFLNWAAGVKIPLSLDLSKAGDLDATVFPRETALQPGNIFEVKLRIRNRSEKPAVARIGHLVDPKEVADYLEFVQCGFLLPVTLGPGEEQEYSGIYLLKGSLPEGVRQLSVTYDFRVLK